MDHTAEVKRLRKALEQSEHVQNELDRQAFYLKTLYDVSQDIFSSVETETILRSFLLMAMGSFGAAEGCILLINTFSKNVEHQVAVGLADKDVLAIKSGLTHLIRQDIFRHSAPLVEKILPADILLPNLAFARDFAVESEWHGIFGLGAKLIGEPYNENDRELLDTLVNNLIVSLKNARSFEKIRGLNRDLESKNLELEKTLKDLQAALRKVEILESIKLNLFKFVPTAVTLLVEGAPAGEIQEARELDISVLFLDIEGYSKITESIGGARVNELVEKYFSVFMDAIYENNGDVVETAGDGLMVLFHNDDKTAHALQAVKTAQTIKAKACFINSDCRLDSQPLVVNIGVCSGQAFVGAAKFESYTGSRWAYTSHGTTTNVAARLCARAKGGQVLVSKSTVDRVKSLYAFSPLGKFSLKNLSAEVDVFTLQDNL